LTLAVALSLAGAFPVPTPVIAALVLGLFVYSIGHLSGTHINPAVTVGAWSIGKIQPSDVAGYLVAQFAGAALALVIVKSAVTPAVLPVENILTVGLAEALGMFFFTFGIASVIYGKTPSVLSGVVVGGSLLAGITVAALLGSNGVLNPAVALGIGSFNIFYILGPVVGSLCGMQAYKYLASA
jgi:glycerol uptake facilitator-like aquaporin